MQKRKYLKSLWPTKKEMIEAYQSLKKQILVKEKDNLDAEKSRKQMEKQLAAATAESETAKDPSKGCTTCDLPSAGSWQGLQSGLNRDWTLIGRFRPR